MNKEDIIRMAREAGLHIATDVNWMPVISLEYAERFAELVAKHTLANIDPSSFMSWQEGYEAGKQTARDELTVMFLEAHEGAKGNHNYWHVAANKIKEKNT